MPDDLAPEPAPPEAAADQTAGTDQTAAAAPSSSSDAAREALARARAAAASAPAPARRPSSSPRPAPGPAAGTDGRDPQLLGSTVTALLRERGWTESAAVGSLTGRWPEIVGADVAEHVRPETFEQAPDGRGLVLVLRADSTAWATSLTYLLPQVRGRVDAELGSGVVRDIRVLGPAAPSWRHGPRSAGGRGPRDTYG